MSKANPFSIRIFVADGDPDGLRIIERSNWNGQAVVFPRSLFPEIKTRDVFERTGVYFLLGPKDDGDGEKLYIGESDEIRRRLNIHFLNEDFWNRAVFFVTMQPGGLNKAHVQYLEARLIALAQAAKRVPLENKNNRALPSLNKAEQADMAVFLKHILQILPLLGVTAFETPVKRASKKNLLFIEAKGLTAKGYESTEGFVVCEDSEVAQNAVPSLSKGIEALRQKLIDSGVMKIEGDHYRVTQNYSFSSPSTAASVVLGRTANGRTIWKNKSGITLKAMQEAMAEKG